MAAATNIVINDGLATPVAHTFAVAKLQPDTALWEDRVAGIYIGYNKLTMSVTRPTGPSSSANRNIKAVIRIETPKLETVSNNTFSGIAPAPTLSYRPQVEIIFTMPERSALQDRKDLLAFMKNVLAKAEVDNLIQNFELSY